MATKNTPREIAGELGDCASLFKCYMGWQGALLAAIGRIAHRDDLLSTEGLSVGDRIQIDELAAIGKHLADSVWSIAEEYVVEADQLRGAA